MNYSFEFDGVNHRHFIAAGHLAQLVIQNLGPDPVELFTPLTTPDGVPSFTFPAEEVTAGHVTAGYVTIAAGYNMFNILPGMIASGTMIDGPGLVEWVDEENRRVYFYGALSTTAGEENISFEAAEEWGKGIRIDAGEIYLVTADAGNRSLNRGWALRVNPSAASAELRIMRRAQ